MKSLLAIAVASLVLSACSSQVKYTCGQNYLTAECKSLSETAKMTKNNLPPKIVDKGGISRDNVKIDIPKPTENIYRVLDQPVENRAKNIANDSTKEHRDISKITKKQMTTSDFQSDVTSIRTGGIQSNNKLAYVNPGTPLLTQPWVVSIYFTPHVNSHGDLDTGGNLYMKIQDSEWVLER